MHVAIVSLTLLAFAHAQIEQKQAQFVGIIAPVEWKRAEPQRVVLEIKDREWLSFFGAAVIVVTPDEMAILRREFPDAVRKEPISFYGKSVPFSDFKP